jgi:hypothetical protein
MTPCVGMAQVLPPSSSGRQVVGARSLSGPARSSALLPLLPGHRRPSERPVPPPLALKCSQPRPKGSFESP